MTPPKAMRKRSTPSASPPYGPPLIGYAAMTMPPDTRNVQNEAAAAHGNATVDEPTCGGTMTIAMPSTSGSRNKNTPATLCSVSTWAASVPWSNTSMLDTSTRSTLTSAPATPATSRNSSEAAM